MPAWSPRVFVAPIFALLLLAGCADQPSPPADNAAAWVKTTTTSTSTTTTIAPTTTVVVTTTAPPPPPPTTTPARPALRAPAPPPTEPPPPPPPPAAPANTGNAVQQVLDHHNAQRAAAGVGPLTLSGCLSTYSQAWAEHMAQTQQLAHNPSQTSQDSNCVAWMAAGENVGQDWSVQAMCDGWMAHSTHRAAILNPAYTQVGIGVAQDAAGALWIVVDLIG